MAGAAKKDDKPKSKSHFSGARLKRAADTQIVIQQPLEIEDEFKSLYESSKNENSLISPPFAPLQLTALCTRNNTLKQAVHTMEVNVDGTGHTFELKEGETDDEGEKQRLTDFFNEPCPGMSMITIRRKLRVDLEEIGYAYLEVVRNVAGEMVFVRHVKAATVRMVKLDQPVEAEKTVMRGGKEFTAKMLVRERRYVQRVGQRLLYFKEYGASRDIDKTTGYWAENGKTIPADKKGSELLRFTVDDDVETPYGIPRWVNNMPSAIGSRKAEEFNLDFFDAGGMPPAIIFIQGGSLAADVRQQLMAQLTQTGKNKHRASVVEVTAATGAIEGSGKVDVKTERFGDTRMNDSMFQKYDLACEEHIRGAFRLPPLFFGKSQDYNFATAMTAYMVAEAQVFAPERKEFDEIINSTVMKELKAEKYTYKSTPITLKDVTTQLEAVQLATGKIDGDELIKKLNEISGLDMQYSAAAEKAANPPQEPAGPTPLVLKPGEVAHDISGGIPQGGLKHPITDPRPKPAFGGPGVGKPGGGNMRNAVRKQMVAELKSMVEFVDDWMVAVGMSLGPKMTAEYKSAVLDAAEKLSEEDRALFSSVLALKSYHGDVDMDMAELASCASVMVGHKH